ncbi:unnamed protein product, partial [Linum tenue]
LPPLLPFRRRPAHHLPILERRTGGFGALRVPARKRRVDLGAKFRVRSFPGSRPTRLGLLPASRSRPADLGDFVFGTPRILQSHGACRRREVMVVAGASRSLSDIVSPSKCRAPGFVDQSGQGLQENVVRRRRRGVSASQYTAEH